MLPGSVVRDILPGDSGNDKEAVGIYCFAGANKDVHQPGSSSELCWATWESPLMSGKSKWRCPGSI
jgi:hypothetical protein